MAAVCPVPSSWLCVVLALVLGLGFGLRPEIFELTLDHTDLSRHTRKVDRSTLSLDISDLTDGQPQLRVEEVQAAAFPSRPLAASSSLLETRESENCTEELARVLTHLQVHGEGPPCDWPGIKCIKGCAVAISRSDAKGSLKVVSVLTSLHRLDLQGSQIHGHLEDLKHMTNLQHLSLPHANVTGDLASLSHPMPLTNLQHVNLTHANVTGDLKNLYPLHRLQELDLHNAEHITGSINVLHHMTELRHLDLHNAEHVIGDIGALRHTKELYHLDLHSAEHITGAIDVLRDKKSSPTSLRHLDLHNAGVSGHIDALGHMKNLRHLDLHKAKAVAGAIDALHEMKELSHLDLHSTEAVAGAIDALVNMTDLRHVDLHNAKRVGGFIDALGNMKELYHLDLHSAETVGGVIDALVNMTELSYLDVYGEDVGGDIAVLSKAEKLKVLDLGKTRVRGTIDSLKRSEKLQVLVLRDAPISGVTDSLRHMQNLTHLDLRYTHIAGSLEFLKGKSEMEFLDLRLTQVAGTLAPLQGLTALHTVALQRSQVSGDLFPLKDLRRLERLYLYGTDVSGELAPLQNLTLMRSLALQETTLSGPLAPLQGLNQLESLELGKTQLSGTLSPLSNLTLLEWLGMDDTHVSGDLGPLAGLQQLRRLRLKRTQVSGKLLLLRNLPKLGDLDLSETEVSGELAALENATQLKWLALAGTNISGVLKSLQASMHLRRLLMAQTRVSGNLASLQNLTNLEVMALQATAVHGDLSALTTLYALEDAFLSGTQVTGWLSSSWLGCCKNLRRLDVAGSRVGDLPPLNETVQVSTQPRLLPALQHLNVSGCSLHSSAEELLLPLAATPLKTIAAAGSGVRGALPDLSALKIQVDGILQDAWASTLGEELQALDLSGNSITSIRNLPAKLPRLNLRGNTCPVTIARGVLTAAVVNHMKINLEGTRSANQKDLSLEVRELKEKLPLQESRRFRNDGKGYACANFVLNNLQVTPESFLPEYMCACQPGFQGVGATCQACPANTFAEKEGQRECEACPINSVSAKGSASLAACKCSYGHARGNEGNRSCQCEPHTAQLESHCLPCSKLHVVCREHGSVAQHAPVEQGYARLAGSVQVFRCLEAERCTSFTDSGCATGYSGPLCVECAPGYHSSGLQCSDCQSLRQQSVLLVGIASLGTLALAAACIAAGCLLRSYCPKPGLGVGCAAQLLVSQAAVLLQLAQLWALQARLASASQAQEVLQEMLADNVTADDPVEESNMDRDPLLSYIEVFQLTGSELQSFLDLQCRFDGATVRAAFALATPLLPLLILVACSFLELRSPGTGIQLALRALTVLFVGGASGAVQLLGCQRTDGEGTWIPDDLAFRPLFPWLRCSKETAAATWVDRIGWTTAAIYGLAVPCFLAFLFFKQRRAMRQCKTFFVVSAGSEHGSVRLELTPCDKSACFEEGLLARRLLAAAAAHLSVQKPGFAMVELHPDAVIVTSQDGSDGDKGRFSAESLIVETSEMEDTVLDRNYLMTMLTERSILEEIESDRMLIGARQLYCKYAYCDGV